MWISLDVNITTWARSLRLKYLIVGISLIH